MIRRELTRKKRGSVNFLYSGKGREMGKNHAAIGKVKYKGIRKKRMGRRCRAGDQQSVQAGVPSSERKKAGRSFPNHRGRALVKKRLISVGDRPGLEDGKSLRIVVEMLPEERTVASRGAARQS